MALEKGKPAQLFRPGGGRGEVMQFHRPWQAAEGQLPIGLLAETGEKGALTITLALSNGEERPWLELKQWDLTPGHWQHENFSLNDLPSEKLAQCDRLILEIKTNLDLAMIYLDEREQYLAQDLGEPDRSDLAEEKEEET